MGLKLVTYEYVPPGFEMVIDEKMICPGSSGGIWNLWWNVQLSDDPETWDGEIRSINKMQEGLGKLTLDQRLIRAQMAEFCRESPLFPGSIDILCMEIGEGRFYNPIKIGCEGRALLDTLGYHDPQFMKEQREKMLNDYALSLRNWLEQGLPVTTTDSKVFGFLGRPTEKKRELVNRLLYLLNSEELSKNTLKDALKKECINQLGEQILDYKGRPFHCFSCPGSVLKDSQTPDCFCCHSKVLDACLLCNRKHSELDAMLEWSKRFTEEYVLAYAMAINSWLTGETSKPVASFITASYITEKQALDISKRVSSSLGEKDESKVWLAACLLKTFKSNQRWHDRRELIDEYPEAISWMSALSSERA